MSSSRRVARNSALNLLGQALPLLAAVVAIPPLMRGLGAERFGVLTLAWAAIGYFSLFEFGLGRALTQGVAERLGDGREHELPVVTWTALTLLLAFGIAGAIVVALLSPVLATRVLNIPATLHGETVTAFWILAAALPAMLTTAGLRGLMEAHQHFGRATLLRIPLAVLTFLGPVLLLPFTRSLVPAVAILAATRVIGTAAHLWVALRGYPWMRRPVRIGRPALIGLLRFGGWTTVSNAVSPMMVYLDRFVIGAMLTIAAVAHYVTPHEIILKVLLVPAAITGAVLPALAHAFARQRAEVGALYDRSLRATMLITFPFVLVAVALAREGLMLWVGPLLPPDSAIVMQWLALGVFVTAIAQTPFAALQSAGRPDLVARLHLAELPVYAVGLFLLTRLLGLPGVAVAWTIRAAADTVALSWIAHRTLGVPLFPRLGGATATLLLVVLLAVAAFLPGTASRVTYVLVTLAVVGAAGWRLLLTPGERSIAGSWFRAWRRIESAGAEGSG